MSGSTDSIQKVYITGNTQKGIRNGVETYINHAIDYLSAKYNFDAEEAKRDFTFEVEFQRGESKPRVKRETPGIPLPWTGEVNPDWCGALRVNHQLYSQCTNAPCKGGTLCKTCQNHADKSSNGKPPNGTVEDRAGVGLMEFRSPKDGKAVVPYANVMAKLGIDRESAEKEAAKFGMTIPEEQFEAKVAKRGRPKKAKSAAEVNTPEGSPKPKRGRGRPRKNTKVVETSVGDDVIASLVADANKKANIEQNTTDDSKTPVNASPEEEIPVDTKEEKKRAKIEEKKRTKLEEKRRAKLIDTINQMKESDADLLCSPIEDMTNDEMKQWIKDNKPKPAPKKRGRKPASPKKKEVDEVVAVDDTASEAETKDEPLQEEEINSDSEEEEEEATVVKRFEHNGVKYLRDEKTGTLYDTTTHEEVGIWNEETQSIDASVYDAETDEE